MLYFPLKRKKNPIKQGPRHSKFGFWCQPAIYVMWNISLALHGGELEFHGVSQQTKISFIRNFINELFKSFSTLGAITTVQRGPPIISQFKWRTKSFDFTKSWWSKVLTEYKIQYQVIQRKTDNWILFTVCSSTTGRMLNLSSETLLSSGSQLGLLGRQLQLKVQNYIYSKQQLFGKENAKVNVTTVFGVHFLGLKSKDLHKTHFLFDITPNI